MKLFDVVNRLVQNSFDAPETWKDVLEKEPINESMLSMQMFFDLLDRDICTRIISAAEWLEDTNIQKLAVTVYLKLYADKKNPSERENILISHIENMIRILEQNCKIAQRQNNYANIASNYAENFQAAVTQMVRIKGGDIFKNVKQLKGLLADITGNKFAAEINDFCEFVEHIDSATKNDTKTQMYVHLIEYAFLANGLEVPDEVCRLKIATEKNEVSTRVAQPSKSTAEAKAPIQASSGTATSASPRTSAPNDDMVLIHGGTFRMGNNSMFAAEKPIHDVTLSSYYISKYQVTQDDWEKVMGDNPSYFTEKGFMSDEDVGLHPVENVSWYDAIKYCNIRSEMEGLTPCYAIDGKNITCDWNADGYRLPTEAEWEYAARGGGKASTQTGYAGSDNIKEVAWYGKSLLGKTHQVGLKKPNAEGLYDMSGNVWEWCWDWYGDYTSGAASDPRGASSGKRRVLRGGCWIGFADYCHVWFRYNYPPGRGDYDIGLRVCCRA